MSYISPNLFILISNFHWILSTTFYFLFFYISGLSAIGWVYRIIVSSHHSIFFFNYNIQFPFYWIFFALSNITIMILSSFHFPICNSYVHPLHPSFSHSMHIHHLLTTSASIIYSLHPLLLFFPKTNQNKKLYYFSKENRIGNKPICSDIIIKKKPRITF